MWIRGSSQMVIAIFVFFLFSSAGRFADFCLGSRGNRILKDRIAEIYVAAGDGNWQKIPSSYAFAFNQFISFLVGSRQIWYRFIIVAVVYSIPLNLAVMITDLRHGPSSWGPNSFFWEYAPALPLLILINCLIDAATLSIVYRLSIVAARSLTYSALSLLLGALLIICMFSVAIVLSDATLSVVTWTDMQHLWSEWSGKVVGLSGGFLRDPVGSFTTPEIPYSHAPFLCLAVAFPATLYVLGLTTSLFLYVLRPILQKPFLLILERLDEAPGGILTVLGVAMGSVSALLGAVQTVLKG